MIGSSEGVLWCCCLVVNCYYLDGLEFWIRVNLMLMLTSGLMTYEYWWVVHQSHDLCWCSVWQIWNTIKVVSLPVLQWRMLSSVHEYWCSPSTHLGTSWASACWEFVHCLGEGELTMASFWWRKLCLCGWRCFILGIGSYLSTRQNCSLDQENYREREHCPSGR